jgi:aquaporin Z
MRVMPIKILTGKTGLVQMKTSFKMNWRYYLQEALGLYIFMVSACFFGAMLFSPNSSWHQVIPDETTRNILMGIAMGSTALFIFYSPWTAPSGSHINPVVTLTFLRLDKMCRYDAMFFIIFQFIGGTLAVYMMQFLMGTVLTAMPVNSVVTIPGKYGNVWALVTECVIAFITMTMVLFTSASNRFKKYTRIFAACLVCCWVIFAGPISGFGMNPARTFASALPAHTWTALWIYLLAPLAGMLAAAELFLVIKKNKWRTNLKVVSRQYEIDKNIQSKKDETVFKVITG